MKRSAALLLAAFAACATSEPAPTPAPVAAPKPVEPPSAPTEAAPALRLPSGVKPTAYRLDYDARPASDKFTGRVEIDVKLSQSRQTIWLHARELTISKAEVRQSGKTIAAKLLAPNDDGLAALTLATPAAAGDATIAIDFSGAFGTRNEGFYKGLSEKTPYLFTQFEATSARLAFPCFDEPAFKAPLTLTITTDAEMVVAANTPIAEEKPVANGKRVQFQPTPPLSSYLYAWTIGPFDVVPMPPIPATKLRTTPLPLRGLAPKGHGKQLGIALAEAQRDLLAEEDYFGIAYPWSKLDIVSVPDFEAGAMENAGLITFRDSVLELDPDHHSLQQVRGQAVDIAHELAHQWFGDLVTMQWWDDVWLNESFASWMEARILDGMHPEFRMKLERAESDDGAMGFDSLATSREIRQPIAKTADIHDAFDGITYAKGEAVIAMFEHWMGAEVFRGGIHDYLSAHAFGNATADDLLGALSKAAGKDIAAPFRTFLEQPGVPLLKAEVKCDKSGAQLALEQTRYLPLGSKGARDLKWQVPICARYANGKSSDIACTLLAEVKGALPLGKACPAWVQPDADLAGYYRWTLPGKQLAAVSKAKLDDVDRFAVVSAIRAGDDASVIPQSDALAALEAFISDPNRQLSDVWAAEAAMVLQSEADDSWRPAIRARARKLYGAQLGKLGLTAKPSDTPAMLEKRTSVIGTMAGLAEDAKTRASLARLGRAYLGVDGDKKVHPEAVAADLAREATHQALAADHSLVAPVMERFETEGDPHARGVMLHALASVHDPAIAAEVRKLGLDPRTHSNEVLDPYWLQSDDYRTRPGEWADLQKNYDALIARVGEELRGYAPFAAGDPCTEQGAKEIEAFFQPRVAADPNIAHGVDQLLEAVHLCAARAEAQRADAKKYFTKK